MAEFERNVYLEDIPLEDARERLAQALEEVGRWSPLPGESIDLADSLGRITAEPVWAKLSSPHYHAAAMDGYAVQSRATREATDTRPVTLKIDHDATPVNTGDPLPPDTDAVIMIEHVQQPTPDTIAIRAAVAPYQHVRLLGEDMVATELVLPVNHRIRPVDLGALAGCGHVQVNVRRQPRVVIIPTGGELVPLDQPPGPGQIIETNSLVLRGQIIESGGEATVTAIMPDNHEALRAALEAAIQHSPDAILILSGSSAGSKDFTASLIREMGTLLVHGVAVRPGHPVIMGLVRDIPVIGVPGYPVSAALTGDIFIQPLLARWLGLQPMFDTQPRIRATMTRKLVSPTGDDDFVRVALARVGERLLATPLSRGAGIITSLVRADGLAHIPRFSEGVDAGQTIDVRLYRDADAIERTIAAMGSHDPLLDVLGQFIAERHPGYRLISGAVGSLGGLVALQRDEAHLAGIHLLDTATGDYNVAYVEKYLPGMPLQLVTFAHREQGILVARGNPLNIQSVDDLPRVRYVNRQRGAGTRVLLDFELQKRGIAPESIAGYEREENTHLAVAAAIASGTADCGMAVRQAAIAMELDFIPVGWERYDFAIPARYMAHDGVQFLLDALNDPAFQEMLGSHPGYDSRETGMVQHIVD